jgi:hypothetical protein
MHLMVAFLQMNLVIETSNYFHALKVKLIVFVNASVLLQLFQFFLTLCSVLAPCLTFRMNVEMMEDGAFSGLFEFQKGKLSAGEHLPGKVAFQP